MKNPIYPAAMLLLATLAANADSQSQPAQQSSANRTTGDKTVKLCDNKTTVMVPNDAPKTRAEGQRISDALMAQWKAGNPNNDWVQGEVEESADRDQGLSPEPARVKEPELAETV